MIGYREYISVVKIFVLFIVLLLSAIFVEAEDGLRTIFLNNRAIICGINIRNFNSQDSDGNGIIDDNEVKGNFINAVKRLDEIKALGINTLHVLPITPTGKLKALGTAGSLYALSDFNSINEQLVDKTSDLLPIEQAKFFIDEAHKRDIKIIVDLPSCGAYDLFLKHPEFFLKDDKQLSIVPSDWTDVRLFNTGDNSNLNGDVINIHKKFIDMLIDIGADGVRADVATIKPSKFWEEIINYARNKNPEFLFLAEASDSWREPPSKYAQFTPFDKLLESGFDGYYGSFFYLKDWKNASELYDHVKFNKKLFDSYKEGKSAILSFTTHDEISPIILHGENFSKMICWLEATLPFNPYIIDGFQTGDDYIYPLGNSKASKTETDDDYYFVHRGKLDIFNFSRKPEGKYTAIADEYKNAMNFRNTHSDQITLGNFVPLKTNFQNIFAYARCYEGVSIIVIGNLNYENSFKKVLIKIPGLNKKSDIKLIKGNKDYKIHRGKLYTNLGRGDIKVLLIENFSL